MVKGSVVANSHLLFVLVAVGLLIVIAYAVLSLAVGALGEVLDYRLCITLCGAFASLICWLTIWRSRRDVAAIYNRDA